MGFIARQQRGVWTVRPRLRQNPLQHGNLSDSSEGESSSLSLSRSIHLIPEIPASVRSHSVNMKPIPPSPQGALIHNKSTAAHPCIRYLFACGSLNLTLPSIIYVNSCLMIQKKSLLSICVSIVSVIQNIYLDLWHETLIKIDEKDFRSLHQIALLYL